MGEIWRGGLQSSTISREKVWGSQSIYEKPSLYTGGAHANDTRRGLNIAFGIASKGGGTTLIHAWFGPDDFEEIARIMALSNPDAAERAFKAAMALKEQQEDTTKSEGKADHGHLVQEATGK